jgi:hypothetical protein
VTKKAAVDLAPAAKAELDQRRADKAVAYWALASILGLLLSATLGLYLLHVVGLRDDGLATDRNWAGGALSALGFVTCSTCSLLAWPSGVAPSRCTN